MEVHLMPSHARVAISPRSVRCLNMSMGLLGRRRMGITNHTATRGKRTFRGLLVCFTMESSRMVLVREDHRLRALNRTR